MTINLESARVSSLHFPPFPNGAPDAPGVHCLFERQALRAPTATAVVCAGQSLSYGELNRRATRLAHQLRLLGVGPNVLVGLSVERSLDLVVGLLGILKAGGAYVPLDPAYPRERLAVMLEESRPPVVVIQPHLLSRLPQTRAELVYVDHTEPLDTSSDDHALAYEGSADDLAYVIFTSGSTGKPKGVMVSHRNVVSLLQATRAWFDFGPDDVWALFHSYAFDFSVWEIWGALAHGGRLVVVPYEASRSPRDMYELLQTERVTVLNQTPSAFRHLIQVEETVGAVSDLALRLVIFGGEALALPSLKPWLERHGDRHPQLVNMYGITETTVHVTYRPISNVDLATGAGSVIGRPIPGWQVHLLDDHLRPVPAGEVGEMYIGGDGVASGYLNRPDLTSERFVPDPFDPRRGGRLYKSGDLARRLPDGDLVYVGRIDHQVKIRGFRIELLEIEAVLARHPNVRETVAIAREDVPGEKRLVAYVVPRQAPAPGPRELRCFLQDRLPDYMVPAAFLFLERLPITGNGKINRDQLPAPAPRRLEYRPAVLGPRNACERKLQRLWEDLLRIQPVGMRDSFFELGGDSLLAMNLCVEIKKEFGADISPITLYEGATIARLAELLAQSLSPTPWSPLVPIHPNGSRPPFFCVHPLGGQVLGYRLLARYLGEDQPFYGLQGRIADDPRATAGIKAMAAQYVEAVTRMQPEGPYYLGGYSLGAFIAYEMAQQLSRQGRRVGFLGLLDDGPALIHDPLRWTVGTAARFLANAPCWLSHQLRRKKASTLLLDIGRKLKVWGRKLWPSRRGPDHVDVEEALDVSHYSEAYRRALTSNYRALSEYRCEPYPGRVSVFRARVQPLLGSHCSDLGWGARAGLGVDVQVIPGDHNTMITEPDVRALGNQLSAALTAAQALPAEALRKIA